MMKMIQTTRGVISIGRNFNVFDRIPTSWCRMMYQRNITKNIMRKQKEWLSFLRRVRMVEVRNIYLKNRTIMKLNPKYQLVVNPWAFPSVNIPSKQQHIHNEQTLTSEQRHNLLKLCISHNIEISVQDE